MRGACPTPQTPPIQQNGVTECEQSAGDWSRDQGSDGGMEGPPPGQMRGTREKQSTAGPPTAPSGQGHFAVTVGT